MANYKENRKRNRLVNFWVTQDEIDLIETRVKLTGKAKGEYLIETLLKQDISISVSKYESDKLSLELSRISNMMNQCDMSSKEGLALLNECKLLFNELLKMMNKEVDADGRSDA